MTADGCSPWGGLIQDNVGNLYGTTSFCGSSGWGTRLAAMRKWEHRAEVIGLSSGGKDYLTWCLAYSSGVNLPALT
jgi:hypothetical protein